MQHHLIGMHHCLFFRLPALNFQFIPFFGQPRVFFGTAAFSLANSAASTTTSAFVGAPERSQCLAVLGATCLFVRSKNPTTNPWIRCLSQLLGNVFFVDPAFSCFPARLLNAIHVIQSLLSTGSNVRAFQLKSIRGSRSFSDSAETINDDDVKQKLDPIVFHAWLEDTTLVLLSTWKEQITHNCKQGFEKKGATQTDAGNMENSGDKTDRATMRSTTHTNQLCLQTIKGGGRTKRLNSRQRNQGYQKTWSAQRIQTIVNHTSRPLQQNMTVDCSYHSWQKLRDPWPSENVETQKLSHTEGRKITSTSTKCLDRADTSQNTEAFTSPVVLSRLVC